jgi:hypothetical protein
MTGQSQTPEARPETTQGQPISEITFSERPLTYIYRDTYDRLLRIEAAARALDAAWFVQAEEGDQLRMRYSSDLPAVLNELRAALEEPQP